MYQQGYKQFQDLFEPLNAQVSKQLSANISLIEELVCAQMSFISQLFTQQREIRVVLNTEQLDVEALNAVQRWPNLIEAHKQNSSLATQRTQQYWADAFQIMQVCLQGSTNGTFVPKPSNASEIKAVKAEFDLGKKLEQADRKPAVQVKKTVKRVRVKPVRSKKTVVATKAQISERTSKADISGKAKSSPKGLLKTLVKKSTKSSVEENKEVTKIADKVAVKTVTKAASSLVLKPAGHNKTVEIDPQNAASVSTVKPISNKVKAVNKLVSEGSK